MLRILRARRRPAARPRANPPARRAWRPTLEPLEDRLAPAIFTVTTNADQGAGSLRAALQGAALDLVGADIITFAPGLQGQTINLASALPPISGRLGIQGPGSGSLTIRRAATAEFSVLTVAGGAVATISGLHLTGGLSPAGGGIRNLGLLSLNDVEIDGSRSDGGNGGGILNQGTLTVTAGNIHGNTADGNGGGIENDGTLTLVRSLVSLNRAAAGGGIAGAGALTVSDSTVSKNTSTGAGGGLALFRSSSNPADTVTRSTVAGNSAGGDGGGILNDAALTVQGSTLSSNTAGGRGGGLFNDGTLTLTNSTFALNRSTGDGGGIFHAGGSTRATNVTVAANVSTGGAAGGIEAPASTGTPFNPGGVLPFLPTGVTLFNTLVAQNRHGSGASAVPDDVLGAFAPASRANLIGVVTGSTGLSTTSNLVGTALGPLDPGLFALQDNGGPTLTMALMPNSPAINRGDKALAAALATDQRDVGFGRVVGTQPGTAAQVDVGAYEFQDIPFPYLDPQSLGLGGALTVRPADNGSSLLVAGPNGYGFRIAGPWARTFTTSQSGGLTYTQETFTAVGPLTVKSALGDLPLALLGGTVQFVTVPHLNAVGGPVASTTLNGQLDLSGQATLFNGKFSVGFTLPSLNWGLKVGADLGNLTGPLNRPAPLNAAVPYFFADITQDFALSFGGTNIPLLKGQIAEVAFDPADPSVYFRAGLFQLGASFHGDIPFLPDALPSRAEQQNVQIFGHLLVGGKSPDIAKLGPFGVELVGDLLLDFDANDDGQALHPDPTKVAQAAGGLTPLDQVFDFASNFASDFAFGLNGTLVLHYKPAHFINLLNLPLAQGTFMFQPGAGAFLRAETTSPFSNTGLDKVIPLEDYAGADLDGFISVSPNLAVNFEVDADLHLGKNTVLGTDVHLTFNNAGIAVDAELDTFVGNVAVHGSVGSDGTFSVTGGLDVGIDLSPLAGASAHVDVAFGFGPSGVLFSAHVTADAFVDVLIARGELAVDLGLTLGITNFTTPFIQEVTGVVTGDLFVRPFGPDLAIQAGVSFQSNVLTVFLPFPLPNVTIDFNSSPALQDRAVSPAAVRRGQAVTLSGVITEPDPGDAFELDVDWGDGTPPQVVTVPPDPATGSVNGLPVAVTHTYEDTDPTGLGEDVYPVVLRWRNPGGGFNTDTLFVTVQNTGLLLHDLRTRELAEGPGLVEVSAEFPALAGPLTAVIDWGDGTSDVSTYRPGLTALGEVHQYAANGTYPVRLTLITADGVRTPATTATVDDVGTSPAVTGPDLGVRGQPLTYTLTAPGAGPLTFALDWNGDGRTDQTVTGPSGTQVTHVFPEAGTFPVVLKVSDAGGPVGDRARLPVQIATVAVEADPADLSQRHLVIGGSTRNDVISVGQVPGGLRVLLQDGGTRKVQQTRVTVPVDWVIVHAQAGNDVVQIGSSVRLPAEVFGDAGNDQLIGGGGNNVLVGGDGDDDLVGGPARDVLIGGNGRDALFENAGQGLLIGGVTAFDNDPAALRAILAEWSSGRDDLTRIANLRGTGSGDSFAARKNGNTFLTTAGPGATVRDDHATDLLFAAAGGNWYLAGLAGPSRDLLPLRRPGDVVDGVS